jgi:magnesium chelatase subunit I
VKGYKFFICSIGSLLSINKKKVMIQGYTTTNIPFSAIIGQTDMKLALILNAIDPTIGGVLLMGDRGTAKSTAVRSIQDLLPLIEVVEADPYNSHPTIERLMSDEIKLKIYKNQSFKTQYVSTPFVTIPLGATEDRVCGSLDTEQVLKQSGKYYQPGLLAQANRGFVYVDEVNLLEDNLVDTLLDSAASGFNLVEREGVSVRHPARFTLIGSANPEEGELRPQLLDRFGMYVNVKSLRSTRDRVTTVSHRRWFDSEPDGMVKSFEKATLWFQSSISHALSQVQLLGTNSFQTPKMQAHICNICSALGVSGIRADITMTRAAVALAALQGQDTVNEVHIIQIAHLCLRHRLEANVLSGVPPMEAIGTTLAKEFDLSIAEIIKILDQRHSILIPPEVNL